MPPTEFLSLLFTALQSDLALVLALILATVLLEDITIIVVGVLAATGALPLFLSLASLYTGIVLGDLGMYSLGRLARSHPRLGRFVDHGLILPLRTWIHERLRITVFTARFIPGSRLLTFLASGYFHAPLRTFFLTIVFAAALWTSGLFTAAYLLGSVTASWIEEARIGAALLALGALFLIARHNVRIYRARRVAGASPA